MSETDQFGALIIDLVFKNLEIENFESVMAMNLKTIIELYNLASLKISNFTNVMQALGHTCDFGNLYGSFHDIHNTTAEGKILRFINPTTEKEFLKLYICPVCLGKLTVNDFVKRCCDFKNIIYDEILEILNAEVFNL